MLQQPLALPAKASAAAPVQSPPTAPQNTSPPVGDQASSPVPITRVQPVYSDLALKLRAEGTVKMSTVVQPDGTPSDIEIIDSMGYGLDEKALEALRKWKFKPAIKDGNPIPLGVNASLEFRHSIPAAGKVLWYSGPLTFEREDDVKPPALKEGKMPDASPSISDDNVIFNFAVDSNGSIEKVLCVYGSKAGADFLSAYLANWRFHPAMKAGRPVPATGKVTFTKKEGPWGTLLPLDPVTVDDAMASKGGPATIVDFFNQSSKAVDIYWIDYNGNRVPYRMGLPPGGTWSVPTCINHPWLIVVSGTGGTKVPDSGTRLMGFMAEAPRNSANPLARYPAVITNAVGTGKPTGPALIRPPSRTTPTCAPVSFRLRLVLDSSEAPDCVRGPKAAPDTWYTGRMSFTLAGGVSGPSVVDGSMPDPSPPSTNETAILEFTVAADGSVKNIRTVTGSQSASDVLPRYLSTWKFKPAYSAAGTLEATGRIRFVRGTGDQTSTQALTPPPAQAGPASRSGNVGATTLKAGTTMVSGKDDQVYIWIPPGAFTMGCSDGDTECSANEKPHPAQIETGFWLGRTEVTQAAWRKVMATNPSKFQGDRLPVEQVSWNDASSYCTAIGGRLPRESEWEYAARAGSPSARYGNLDEIAWHSGNAGGVTHTVAGKKDNAFGLFDMLGNVWEWVEDNYPGGQLKVERGGNAFMDSRTLRASMRGTNLPTRTAFGIGFRCAISNAEPNAKPDASSATAVRSAPGTPLAPDAEAWAIVRDSNSAELLEQFLKEYPNSQYAGVARLKLAASAKPAVPSQPAPPETSVTGPIYRSGDVATRPGVLFRVDPEYPEEARNKKISGTVTLSVVVTAEGKAAEAHVEQSLGRGFDEKAIEAVRKWKFAPATRDGKPVNTRALIDVNFVLR